MKWQVEVEVEIVAASTLVQTGAVQMMQREGSCCLAAVSDWMIAWQELHSLIRPPALPVALRPCVAALMSCCDVM